MPLLAGAALGVGLASTYPRRSYYDGEYYRGPPPVVIVQEPTVYRAGVGCRGANNAVLTELRVQEMTDHDLPAYYKVTLPGDIRVGAVMPVDLRGVVFTVLIPDYVSPGQQVIVIAPRGGARAAPTPQGTPAAAPPARNSAAYSSNAPASASASYAQAQSTPPTASDCSWSDYPAQQPEQRQQYGASYPTAAASNQGQAYKQDQAYDQEHAAYDNNRVPLASAYVMPDPPVNEANAATGAKMDKSDRPPTAPSPSYNSPSYEPPFHDAGPHRDLGAGTLRSIEFRDTDTPVRYETSLPFSAAPGSVISVGDFHCIVPQGAAPGSSVVVLVPPNGLPELHAIEYRSTDSPVRYHAMVPLDTAPNSVITFLFEARAYHVVASPHCTPGSSVIIVVPQM